VVDVPLIILITAALLGLVESALHVTTPTQPPFTMVIGWIALYSFGTYWALNIRRALAVRLYRSQALGIGLVAASVIVLVFSEIIIAALSRPGGSGPFGEPVELPFSYFAIIVLFYWVDVSVRTARRSDPLLRDTLYWTRLRIIAWAGIILLIAFNSLYVLYLMIDTGLPLDVAPNLPPVLNIVSFMSFLSPVLLGAIFLPLGALRSRDPTIRRHLGWFCLFVLLILATSLIFLAQLIPVPSSFEALLYIAVTTVPPWHSASGATFFVAVPGRLHR
jgi:hypothetical protein